MKILRQKPLTVFGILACFVSLLLGSSCMNQEKIGVVYVVHGGFEQYHPQHLWDSSVQLFSYNPNHPVYKLYLWNSNNWGEMLKAGDAPKEIGKYSFEYGRIGGKDPFHELTDQQLAHMEQSDSGDTTLNPGRLGHS